MLYTHRRTIFPVGDDRPREGLKKLLSQSRVAFGGQFEHSGPAVVFVGSCYMPAAGQASKIDFTMVRCFAVRGVCGSALCELIGLVGRRGHPAFGC